MGPAALALDTSFLTFPEQRSPRGCSIQANLLFYLGGTQTNMVSANKVNGCGAGVHEMSTQTS